MTIAELVAKLERTAEGSRELDAVIWWRIDRKAAERVYWSAATGLPRPLPDELPPGLGRLAVQCYAPAYTSSLDAALTLVPEGMAWDVRSGGEAIAACIAEGEMSYPHWALVSRPGWGSYCDAHTPALALCVAALKARLAV